MLLSIVFHKATQHKKENVKELLHILLCAGLLARRIRIPRPLLITILTLSLSEGREGEAREPHNKTILLLPSL
jgi:hypothetical protein